MSKIFDYIDLKIKLLLTVYSRPKICVKYLLACYCIQINIYVDSVHNYIRLQYYQITTYRFYKINENNIMNTLYY